MRQNALQKIFKADDMADVPKGVKPIVIWILAGAIAFLALSGMFGGDGQKKTKTSAETALSSFNADEYIEKTEKRLTETLKKISGIGEVAVFISIEGGGEKILATDQMSRSSTDSRAENQELNETEIEQSIVMKDDGAEQTPFVVKEKFPLPAGVLVVAEGAGNERVEMEVYEAVQALFGLPAHRIKITH